MQRTATLILSFYLLFSASAFARSGRGHVLIIHPSDTHSAYWRAALHIQAVSKLTQDFLERYPDGDVVYADGGDLSSKRGYTTSFFSRHIQSDYGELGLAISLGFARYMHVVNTLGNHEQFDWGASGNDIFITLYSKYLRELSQLQGREAKVLAGNLDLAPDWGEKLFAPHADLKLKNGETLRVIGLVLDRFFRKTKYDRVFGTPLFTAIHPMYTVAKKEVEQAAEDGVRTVFSNHANVGSNSGMMLRLNNWRKLTGGKVAEMEIPWVGSGHTHRPTVVLPFEDSNGYFTQPGCDYDFATIHLGPDHRPVSTPILYDENAQKEVIRGGVVLRPYEQKAMEQVEKKLKEIQGALSLRAADNGILVPGGVPEIKENLQREPSVLGIRLAEILARYAATHRFPHLNVVGHIGIWNPSGYRLDHPIPGGRLSAEDFHAMDPHDDETLGLLVPTDTELQAIVTKLRLSREKEGTFGPQLSSHYRMDPDGKLLQFHEGKWGPLRRGYHVASFDTSLARESERVRMLRMIQGSDENRSVPVTDKWVSVAVAHAEVFTCPNLIRFIGENGLVSPEVAAKHLGDWQSLPASPSANGAPRGALLR